MKSSTEDASFGIAQASVVADEKQLAERIVFIHEQTHSDALVEEYIEGRELYVGVLGNDRLKVLPVWEMSFGSLPENLPAIATRKVKWDRGYQRNDTASPPLPPLNCRMAPSRSLETTHPSESSMPCI